ncbi:hypothetical protein EDB89DRAFT_2072330, partial [Lactarius sanguifluus]
PLISVPVASPKSQSAIEAARKDLGEYVSQAQKGLNEQFATLTPQLKETCRWQPHSSSRDLVDATTTDGESSAPSFLRLRPTATLPDLQQEQEDNRSNRSSILIHRHSLPELAQAAQARVHGAAARGEVLLRGASVFLRDAVRVVPPEPAAPASASTPPAFDDAVTPRAEAPSPVAISVTPATRRDALLRALRATPAIIRVDPVKEERSATLFVTWAQVEDLRDGTQREVELAADGGALQVTLNAGSVISPPCGSGTGRVLIRTLETQCRTEELSEDEFWTRYTFRVYQINQEDERRKAVLEGPTAQEEDFSWEDEEEDVLPRREPSMGSATVVGQRTESR